MRGAGHPALRGSPGALEARDNLRNAVTPTACSRGEGEFTHMRSLIAALATACLAVSLAHAQTPPAPAPPPTPPSAAQSIVGRQITLEEAVGIALEGQPQIVARLADYQAARLRVDQALAPLLPQLGGSWTAARTQSVSQSTPSAANPRERTLTD